MLTLKLSLHITITMSWFRKQFVPVKNSVRRAFCFFTAVGYSFNLAPKFVKMPPKKQSYHEAFVIFGFTRLVLLKILQKSRS